MASLVCKRFRLPDESQGLHDYIETVDDAKYIAFQISERDQNGSSTAYFVSKT